MAYYESTFIARQDMSKQDVAGLAERFSAIVREHGGEILKNEYWGLRNLTYRINKSRKGHYTMLAISANAAAISELNRNLRISEDVVRSLTVRVDEIEEGPSIMLNQNKREDSAIDVDSVDAMV